MAVVSEPRRRRRPAAPSTRKKALHRAILIPLSAIAVLGAAACSPPRAEPEAAEPTAPPTTSPPVPQVENPKSLTGITDACQLLTPEQLAALGGGGDPEESESLYGESQCFWRNDNFATNVAINTTFGGTAKIFESPQSSDNFAPTQVDGYPAARVDEQSTLCRVEVGLSEDQSVEINYSKRGGDAPEMQDPCGYAEKIAGEVLKNVPDA